MVDTFKISVIIPNYNRSDLLKLAIESALNQTFAPLEILVCDDGSTDDSKDIVSTFDSTIVKWIDCGKNGRPSIPRNIGIRNAKGTWIAFLDNDDIWLPDKLANQIQYIYSNKEIKAICTNAFRLRNNDSSELYFKELSNGFYSFEHLFHSNPVICSSVLIAKKALDELSYFPEEKEFKAIEDYALWIRISVKYKFYYINTPMLKYRDDEISDSIRKNYNTIEEIRKVIFPDFNQWLSEKNITLSSRNRIDLDKRLYLLNNNNKLGFKSNICFKIRYKINDWRK